MKWQKMKLQIKLIMDSLLGLSFYRSSILTPSVTCVSLKRNQEDQLLILTYSNKIAFENKKPGGRSANNSSLSLNARESTSRKCCHHHGDFPSLLSFLLCCCGKQVSQVFKIYFAVHAGQRHTDHRADLTSAILPFRSFSTRMTSLLGLLSRSTYSTISRSGRRSLYSTIS
jgi:hypothetical protein